MGKVWNVKTAPTSWKTHPNVVYVGRKVGERFHFGNPFTHLKGVPNTISLQSREEAIDAFQSWIDGTSFQDVEPERRQWILDNMGLLKGKHLMCYCAPLACHADILLRMANKENE